MDIAKMSLTNLDFINIAHGIDNTRVYRVKDEFYCYTSTIEEIIPFGCKKAINMAKHLNETLKNSWGEINLTLNYKQGSYNKKKMKRLNRLLGEGLTDVNEKELLKWLMFLF